MIRKGNFGSVYIAMIGGEIYAVKAIQFIKKSFYEKLVGELKKAYKLQIYP